MLFGKTGRECRLNFLKFAPSPGSADVDPIGMEGFESTLASPECEKPCIVEEGQQKVFVIARQRDDGSRPFGGCKLLDHALRARTTIDVITQKNRDRLVERLSFHIGPDALGHLAEQVVTTVDITHAVHESASGHSTRSRNGGRSLKGLEERIRPPREFVCRYTGFSTWTGQSRGS